MSKKLHPGDSGYTNDFANNRQKKGDCLTNALGDIDELIAYLGLVKYIVKEDKEFITNIQKQLQTFAASLANYPHQEQYVTLTELEQKINLLNSKFTYDNQFFIPGHKEIPTFINITRTICRRAERSIVQQKPDDSSIIPFMNRLSTYLFALQIYYDKK
ncbi:MAG: ATP:cob(I)alamin adenosyltransferase [Patescibacteria group bacterium]